MRILLLLVAIPCFADEAWLTWWAPIQGMSVTRVCADCQVEASMTGDCHYEYAPGQGYDVQKTVNMTSGAECVAVVSASSEAIRTGPPTLAFGAINDTIVARGYASAVGGIGFTSGTDGYACLFGPFRNGTPIGQGSIGVWVSACYPPLPPPNFNDPRFSQISEAPLDNACSCTNWASLGMSCVVPANGAAGTLQGRACAPVGCGASTYCKADNQPLQCISSPLRELSCGATSPDGNLTCPANQKLVGRAYDCSVNGPQYYCVSNPGCAPDFSVAVTSQDFDVHRSETARFIVTLRSLNGWSGNVYFSAGSALAAAFMQVGGNLPFSTALDSWQAKTFRVDVTPGLNTQANTGYTLTVTASDQDDNIVRESGADFRVVQ